MPELQVVIWLFPIIFMFHDFEEILLMQVWIERNRSWLGERFPKLSPKMLPHFGKLNTASFALGVAEEFIVISFVTAISFVLHTYALWLGLFLAFTLHLGIHCVQALIAGRYVPALATSMICLPVCLLILAHILPCFTWSTIVGYAALGVVLMVSNLLIAHWLMVRFGKWMVQYGACDNEVIKG